MSCYVTIFLYIAQALLQPVDNLFVLMSQANQEPAGQTSEPQGANHYAGCTSEPVDNPIPSKSKVPKRKAYTQPTMSSVNRVIIRKIAASQVSFMNLST